MRNHIFPLTILFLLLGGSAPLAWTDLERHDTRHDALDGGATVALSLLSARGGGVSSEAKAVRDPNELDADTILYVNISRSPKDKEANSKAFHYEEGRNTFAFSCEVKSVASIVSELLEIGSERLRVDPSISSQPYNVSFYRQQPFRRPRQDRKFLMETFLRYTGAEVVEVAENQEVWVARQGDNAPPKSERRGMRGGSIVYKEGQCIVKSMPISKLLSAIEKRYHVFIEDKTELTGQYDLTYPTKYDFKKLRSHLADKYGLTLTRVTRKITTFRVKKQTETDDQSN